MSLLCRLPNDTLNTFRINYFAISELFNTFVAIMRQISKINIFYVIFWGIISFVSTFSYVFDGSWCRFLHGDLLNDLFKPIFLWIIAFFGDYLFVVYSIDKSSQTLDDNWTRISYGATELIFVLLLLSIYCNSISWLRTIFVILLFISIMTLKMASLCSPCPRQKVIAI